MSFEQNLPIVIEQIQLKLAVLEQKLRDGTHYCDCEYCDRGDDLDEEDRIELENEIAEVKSELRRLKQYREQLGLVVS